MSEEVVEQEFYDDKVYCLTTLTALSRLFYTYRFSVEEWLQARNKMCKRLAKRLLNAEREMKLGWGEFDTHFEKVPVYNDPNAKNMGEKLDNDMLFLCEVLETMIPLSSEQRQELLTYLRTKYPGETR